MKALRFFLLFSLFIPSAGSLFNYHPNLSRAQTDQAGANACCSEPDETAPREFDFPYYTLANGFNSTVLLVSDLPKPLDFVMAVHSRSGQTVLAPGMTIRPQEKLPVDLRNLLTSLSADVLGDFSEGSVSVYFNGPRMPLAGQLTMTNPARGLSLESEVVDNSPGLGLLPSVLNGLWWGLGGSRDARLMVSNASGNAVVADLYLDYLGERHPSQTPLTFRPHETKVLSIAQLLGDLKTSPAQAPEGGITIVPRGAQPSLMAQGKITDVVTGFSTTLNFPDPGVQHSSALHASGVPIGKPTGNSPYAGAGVFTPHVILRNLTSGLQTVKVTIEYPREDGPTQTTLPPFSLPPYGVEDIPLTSYFDLLPLPLPFCSIRIEYSGPPGSAMAEVSSVEQKGDLVVDSRLANEGDGWAGSGGHPWHLDDETESVLFLTNMGDRATPIGFQLQANGVHYYLADLALEPHETRAVDLRRLRDAQVPDLFGTKIPAGATDGSVVWVRADNVPVMGRLLVMQRHKGLASNYDCQLCQCGLRLGSINLTMSPYSADLHVGDWQQFHDIASMYDCSNSYYPVQQDSNSSWATDPSNVTSVSLGKVTGLAGGSSTVQAQYAGCMSWGLHNNVCYCASPRTGTGSGAARVIAPTNFHMVGGGEDAGGGALPLLRITFAWQSSTGNLADLSACDVREHVTYSTTGNFTCPNNNPPQNCYYGTSPPWPNAGQPGTGYPNPTDIAGPATAGGVYDDNVVTNLSFVQPYSANSFDGTQKFQYSCDGHVSWKDLYGPKTITRSISKNAQGKWVVTVSRSDTTTKSVYVIPGQ